MECVGGPRDGETITVLWPLADWEMVRVDDIPPHAVRLLGTYRPRMERFELVWEPSP
jgi:hypothetical protein